MRKNTIKFGLLTAFAAVFIFTSCNPDPEPPKPEPEQEEIDEAKITFIELDENGDETTDSVIVRIDENGRPKPHHIHLHHHESYRVLITLYYKGHAINDEIKEESTTHQFFFITSKPDVINYEYKDADANGRGVGLVGKMDILKEESYDLKIVLRHGLDKTHVAAQNWSNPDYHQAGGTDDLNVEFEIHVVDEDHDHGDHDDE